MKTLSLHLRNFFPISLSGKIIVCLKVKVHTANLVLFFGLDLDSDLPLGYPSTEYAIVQILSFTQ